MAPVNGSSQAATLPTHQSDSAVKFVITSDSGLQPRIGKVTNDNSAIYQPIPNVGSTRGSDPSQIRFTVEVKLLNDEQDALLIDVNAAVFGQWLFDEVINRLGGLLESDYFGLRYLDKSKQRQWLDLSKTVYKQLKNVKPRSLNFRVKHYPAKPLEEFKQEKSRYFLYLQLRRDLHSGRLIGRNNDMHVLAAHILQAEIGDIDKLEDYLGDNGSLAELKMFENMTPRVEAKIREMYKTLRGLSVADTEAKFLERASELETYGVEPVFVQDRKGNHFYVGLSHEGVTAFRGNRKAHVFLWSKIHRISFDGKLFVIQVEWENSRHTLGFKCQTTEAAEALWKWAVDRQCFFTLNKSTEAKKSKANGRLFRRRRLYSFTGRCQKEMLQMTSSMPNIPQPSVSRSRSLLNIAKSVSLSRQTKSHEELNSSLIADSNSLNGNKNGGQNGRSVSEDAFAGGVRLAGVNSESAEQLVRKGSHSSDHNTYAKLYRSSEFISTTNSLIVTSTGPTGELSPKIGTAWSPVISKKLDPFDEVASREVDEALTHAEIMRLVTHRQVTENEQTEEVKPNEEAPIEEMKMLPVKEPSSASTPTKSPMNSKKDDSSIENTKPPIPSPISPPWKLNRQGSIERSPQNRSYSSSESYSTQVHRPNNQEMVIDRADTIPSESTPLSSSSTPLSSPKIEKEILTRSALVDPPSGFADGSTRQNSKDIYFPYLSKVRNLDRGYQEKLYQPLRFTESTRDPFVLPSKTEELSVSIEPTSDAAEYSSAILEPSAISNGGIIKTMSRIDNSPLLLRHGYISHREYDAGDHLESNHIANEPKKEVGPLPTIVRAGCAPPVAEPIIVAEYFIPLCDDEEEEDEDDSEAGLAGVSAVSKEADRGNFEKPQIPMQFDWSAASARLEKSRQVESSLETPRLPAMTTVVLSQEIISPRRENTSPDREGTLQPVDAVEGFIAEKSAVSPTHLHQYEINMIPPNKSDVLEELAQVPVSRCVSQEISTAPDLIETKPVLQRTLIQVPQIGGCGDGDRRREEKHTDTTQKAPVTTHSNPSSGESYLSPTLVQIFWFFGVFIFVHHALKAIRVGPILGFFGATGPEAIGCWSAIEVIIDFIFFRLF